MRFLLALIIFIPSVCLSADLVSSVPSQFRGEWNASLSACGTGDSDSALHLHENRISYYESEGPIRAVVIHGRYEIVLITELSGEGETWLSTEHFKLSFEENALISVSFPGREYVRYRCPVNR